MSANRLRSGSFFVLLVFASVQSIHAQWVPINGAGGHGVCTLAVQGTTVFAATGDALIYSVDSGAHWMPLRHEGFLSLAVDRTSVYASNHGVSRSSDAGVTWKSSQSGFYTSTPIEALAVHNGYLFAGMGSMDDNEVYRSSDSGQTWKPVLKRSTMSTIAGLAASGPNIIAADENSLQVSSNDGLTWHELSNGIQSDTAPYRFPTLSAVAAVGTRLFVASRCVYRSTFNGADWTRFDTCLSGTNVTSFYESGANLFAGTQDGLIYGSSDTGNSWTRISTVSPASSIMSFARLGTILFVTTPIGVSRSLDNGIHWEQVYTSLTAIGVQSIAWTQGSLFAATDLSIGVARSNNAGADWTIPSDALRSLNVLSLLAMNANIIAGTDSGVYVSHDEGANWVRSMAGMSVPAKHVRALFYDNGRIYAATDDGVFVSNDTAMTWSAMNNGFLNSSQQYVTCFTTNGTTLMAGCWGGYPTGIYESTNDGGMWIPIDQSSGLVDQEIEALGKNNGYVFAASGDRAEGTVFRSTNDGSDWAQIAFLNARITSFVFSGQTAFAATIGKGVMASTNYGKTWFDVNSPSSPRTINTLTIIGGDLFTATSNGVWRRPLSEMVGTNAVSENATAKRTLIAYPNPCVRSTSIVFVPEASGYAEISIVNMLGQPLALVYSGVLDVSEHRFTWETQAKACGTGVYQCIVRMNGRVQTVAIVVD